MAERIVRAVITGRVQGVGYRAWVAEEANRRGLSGWVRNRRNGSVEALLAGDAAVVEALLAACHEGPPAAAVADVAVADTMEPAGAGFVVLPTA